MHKKKIQNYKGSHKTDLIDLSRDAFAHQLFQINVVSGIRAL